MKSVFLFCLTIILFNTNINAQIKKELLDIYHTWNQYKENYDYEQASEQLGKFKSTLMVSLEEDYPSALDAIQELMAENYDLTILSSPDDQLYVISWEEGNGGTMRTYDGVYFYKTTHGKGRVLDKYPNKNQDDCCEGSLPYGLYQVKDFNQKNIYILFEVFIGSSANSFHQVKTMSIDNYILNPDAKFIKTLSGLNNTIQYEVDWSVKSMRNSNLDREDERMTFNTTTSTILLPLIHQDGKLTRQKIAYKFNGNLFEKLGK